MAIFTADELASDIEQCSLDGRDATCLATCAYIPTCGCIPPLSGVLTGEGWVDILDVATDGEYLYFTVGNDGEPVTTRHYGIVTLEWSRDA